MKNKALIKSKEYRAFRRKIFARIAVMVFISIAVIGLLYSFVIDNHFADFIVRSFQSAFHMERDVALSLYYQIFRNNMDIIMLASIIIIFLIVFRIYTNCFTNYFEEINKGIDGLINENAENISLSSELLPLERKLNIVKHTIEKQKSDMMSAEQRKNDLIMYLAHDLKTPLASVIGYLNLLHDEKQISEELREKYLSVSLDKAERLEDLINEFFEISKYNLSTITLQYGKINLARLLEMLLYEFQPMLKEKNLTCNLSVSDDITMKCDANKIQRAFDNLLRNAVIYSFDGTNIDISVTEKGSNAVIEFTNHCDTIPTEKLDRIFEQFYRLDAARSSGSGGAGLGLAIAKQIIELHGGTITAESENETVRFEITLPAS